MREHPQDPSASYALGALCAREGLWGKAQAALKSALTLAPDPRLAAAIHLTLAQVFEAIGDSASSLVHFREAAQIAAT